MFETGFVLKSRSSRQQKGITNLTGSFDNELYADEDLYSFCVDIELYKASKEGECTNEKIAIIKATLFDIDKIENAGNTLDNAADMISQDVYTAIATLSTSKIYRQNEGFNDIFIPLYACYINTFYIYPEYRKMGAARYLFTNLNKILRHCFCTEIHSFVTYPNPQEPDTNGGMKDYPDEKDNMLRTMKTVLRKTGYKQIGKTGYYALNCASTNDF